MRRLAGTAAVVAGVTAYGHFIGGNELEVSHLHVPVEGWPAGAPPLKIGLLSDFHCDSDTAVERSRRAVAMLLAESPDAVLLGGDYITWNAQNWIAPMAQALAPLAVAPGGAYGVLGNHDWWSGEPTVIAQALRASGIRILRNESVPLKLNPHVWVCGVDDVTNGQQDARRALRMTPPDAAVKLLLVHEPDFADLAPAGFALQLSGHSHAGQVRILGQPIYCPNLGRKYPQGLQQSLNHPVYTTRGVGMMNPKVRIDCPPEVTVLTLGGE